MPMQRRHEPLTGCAKARRALESDWTGEETVEQLAQLAVEQLAQLAGLRAAALQ
jgi:hypothetical protein